ncbi:penicillin-binding protein 2 [Chitinimonas lacunae]|uniref:Peptidoglycan D,D-transpeptidase MrdA n=1 Tax=Chitinimonas lacunae TaxID=1963018 RepID=A0ABV8MTW1_9NEIS
MSRRTELRNPQRERYNFQLRLWVAIAVVLAGFGVLLSRFFFLQVVEHDKYHTMAETNRISLVPIPPPRGIITDRNGVVLARNHSAYTLEITPSKVEDLNATIDALAKLIEISPRDRRRFKKLMEESKDFASLPIKTRLSDEEVARFAVNAYRFPGVEIKARLFRHYPMGESASHLLGYIGRINDRDLVMLEEDGRLPNYRGSDHMGKFGLEQSYEEQLHGKTGYEEVEIDANGRAVNSLKRTPPISGNNLVLTVDIKLQQLAEQAFGNNKGALVAIEPATGGVLALVSRPGFDPNLFVDGIDPQSWRELNESPDHPLNNRAIQGTYMPGSTFKPFMALGALELGKRTPHQAFADPGYFLFGNHRFNDDKPGGHGMVDLERSIVVSCDTYYYLLANDMGIDNIARFMKPLGFGQKSGIDLPGEKAGVLPSTEWKRRAFQKPQMKKWYAGETVSIAIGQGYNSYTPLQLAQATSILANRGVVFRPHLVRYIENSMTRARTMIEPQPVARLPYKPQHLDTVTRAMVNVNKAGTSARVFANAGYDAAGKTGTAQRYSLRGATYIRSQVAKHLQDDAWFIVFAPADKPRIALALIVENGGFGAEAAAPIARKVLDYYLLGKLPKEPAKSDAPAAAATSPAAESASPEPAATLPSAAQPSAAQPSAAQPSAAQPSAAQPNAAQPEEEDHSD